MTHSIFLASVENPNPEPLMSQELLFHLGTGQGIKTLPIPGVRCKKCAENGEEVWVVPGLVCGKCGTPAPEEDHDAFNCSHHDDF
ncbi:hypothetical protein P885DRAFT_81651 [Corynascus similis CBS 632.67]